MIVSVPGVWGNWAIDVACNAGCESQGVQGDKRMCSAPQNGGEECTRSDSTKTTPENRLESRESPCENTTPCPGRNTIFYLSQTSQNLS